MESRRRSPAGGDAVPFALEPLVPEGDAGDPRAHAERLEALLRDQHARTRALLGHLRHLRQVLPRIDDLTASLRDAPLPVPASVAAMDLLLALDAYDEAARHSRAAARDPSWERHVGSVRTCACCGERSAAPGADRRCAACGSSSDDRLLWAWLVSRTGISRERTRVLHAGASPAIRDALGRCPDLRLAFADRGPDGPVAFPPTAVAPVDDGALDLAICDRPPWGWFGDPRAVAELDRALAPGGAVVCVVSGGADRTPERDLVAKLRRAGFEPRLEALPGIAGAPLARRCGFVPEAAVLTVERRVEP